MELAFAELTQTVSTTSAETSVSSQQITWTLQPASATVQKGQLVFTGNSLPSVPVLSGQRSLQVAGLQPGQAYTATLTLVLDNQQTIEQVVSLTQLQGIQRWQIHYQTNSHGDLHAQLAWSLPDELTAQVASYQVRSASLGNNQAFTVANSKRGWCTILSVNSPPACMGRHRSSEVYAQVHSHNRPRRGMVGYGCGPCA